MDNKAVLNKLLKIAENQQKILMKIAQSVDPGAAAKADEALKSLLRNTHSIWVSNNNIFSGLKYSISRSSGEKSYENCNLILTIMNEKDRAAAEDPGKGLLKMEQDAFNAASQNQSSPLYGYSANLTMEVKVDPNLK